jgi:hypothetical protein
LAAGGWDLLRDAHDRRRDGRQRFDPGFEEAERVVAGATSLGGLRLRLDGAMRNSRLIS